MSMIEDEVLLEYMVKRTPLGLIVRQEADKKVWALRKSTKTKIEANISQEYLDNLKREAIKDGRWTQTMQRVAGAR
jgi:hypothetical protein